MQKYRLPKQRCSASLALPLPHGTFAAPGYAPSVRSTPGSRVHQCPRLPDSRTHPGSGYTQVPGTLECRCIWDAGIPLTQVYQAAWLGKDSFTMYHNYAGPCFRERFGPGSGHAVLHCRRTLRSVFRPLTPPCPPGMTAVLE